MAEQIGNSSLDGQPGENDLSDLYRAAGEADFAQALLGTLKRSLGSDKVTIVVNDKDVPRVTYSTVLDGRGIGDLAPATVRAVFETIHQGGVAKPPGLGCTIYAAAELRSGDSLAGWVWLHEAVDSEELNRVATRAGWVLGRINRQTLLQDELDLMRAKLESINQIGELLGSLDLEVLLTKLMELSLYIVEGQVGSIILIRESDGEVESPIEWGLPLSLSRSFRNTQGEPIYSQVIETGEAVAIGDFQSSTDYEIVDADVQLDSYLCIPLISKKRVLGVINLINSSYTEMDREILMTICGLAATSIENAMLYQDSIEKERYKESLKIARDIQKKLYPERAPEIRWLDIAARTESCDETGGDYYDYFVHKDGSELTLVIGDVSGHGIGAALHMVAARAGLRSVLDQNVDLSHVFQSVNEQLETDMEIDQFMTMFISTFRALGKELVYVNAGHDAPCVYRKKSQEVEELGATGIPLGLFPGQEYRLGKCEGLSSGDVFLAMTDGVWEVHNPNGDMLGKEALVEIFSKHSSELTSASEIAQAIIDDVNDYTAGESARDDVTLVVVKAR